jgi:hypothetical protein
MGSPSKDERAGWLDGFTAGSNSGGQTFVKHIMNSITSTVEEVKVLLIVGCGPRFAHGFCHNLDGRQVRKFRVHVGWCSLKQFPHFRSRIVLRGTGHERRVNYSIVEDRLYAKPPTDGIPLASIIISFA